MAKATGVLDGSAIPAGPAPRLLSGKVSPTPALTSVSLRLRRSYRGRCYAYDGASARFVRSRCGQGSFFKVSTSSGFSYLLPATLARGRYVLDVQATDTAGNNTSLARGSSRIVFYVGEACRGARAAGGAGAGALRLRPRRGQGAERRRARRHARLRREGRALVGRAAGARPGDGDEPADAQRDRVHRATAVASCRASTGWPAGSSGGHSVDWFYYVNGIEASKGAAATNVHPGDHIWWDRHDWSPTDDVRAVVGSFPEPFPQRDRRQAPAGARGMRERGRLRLPHRDRRLRAQHVPAAVAALGSGAGAAHTLRVAVGTWREIAGVSDVRELSGGRARAASTRASRGRAPTLRCWTKPPAPRRRSPAGAGLIAATRNGEDAPVWAVTGTDAAGVTRAASAFDGATLKNRFAVAVDAGAPALPRPGR